MLLFRQGYQNANSVDFKEGKKKVRDDFFTVIIHLILCDPKITRSHIYIHSPNFLQCIHIHKRRYVDASSHLYYCHIHTHAHDCIVLLLPSVPSLLSGHGEYTYRELN